MKALLIEDSLFYQKIIGNFLKSHDIEYDISEYGSYALELLSLENYDLIFLDINLPDINGWEVLENLPEDLEAKIIPVTGYESEEIIRNLQNHPRFTEYLIKPFGDEELADILDLPSKKTDTENQSVLFDLTEIKTRSHLLHFCHQIGFEHSGEILEIFKKTLVNEIPSLKNLYYQGHFSEVESIVHQVKANCKYLGFHELANICEDLERNILNLPPEVVNSRIDEMMDMTGNIHHVIDLVKIEISQPSHDGI